MPWASSEIVRCGFARTAPPPPPPLYWTCELVRRIEAAVALGDEDSNMARCGCCCCVEGGGGVAGIMGITPEIWCLMFSGDIRSSSVSALMRSTMERMRTAMSTSAVKRGAEPTSCWPAVDFAMELEPPPALGDISNSGPSESRSGKTDSERINSFGAATAGAATAVLGAGAGAAAGGRPRALEVGVWESVALLGECSSPSASGARALRRAAARAPNGDNGERE